MTPQSADKFYIDTILGRFEFYSAIADAFGLLILKQIFEYAIGITNYFKSNKDYYTISAWQAFLEENLFPILAAVAVISVYWLGKGFAKKNISQLPGLFSADRIPRSVNNDKIIPSPAAIPGMIVVNFSIFAALVYCCYSPILFAVGIIGLHLFYLYFNRLQRRGIDAALSDARYFPAENRHKKFTERRRALAIQYLFKRPHTPRECMVILAALVSLALIIWGPSYGINGWHWAYILTISAMVLNELIVRQWRKVLDFGLEQANKEQALEDMEDLGENRPSLEPS